MNRARVTILALCGLVVAGGGGCTLLRRDVQDDIPTFRFEVADEATTAGAVVQVVDTNSLARPPAEARPNLVAVEESKTNETAFSRTAALPNGVVSEEIDTNNLARMRSGLLLNVVVFVDGKKEIEALALRVSKQNTITLPLLGQVPVKGLSLDETRALLAKEYGRYILKPQVTVEFADDGSEKGAMPWGYVTVLGRVKLPGRIGIPPTTDMTVSEAIQKAGGYDTSANQSAIKVTRTNANTGRQEVHEVDLHAVGAQGRVQADIVLEPNDVVFVPRVIF